MEKRFSVQNRRKKVNENNRTKKIGRNLIDRVIDKIPFELHVPTYQYCGPGTHLEKRLKRGDPGINPLDAACKIHDIAYNKHKDSNDRSIADQILQNEALKRVFAKDSTFGEKTVALGVAATMKVKRKMSGKGLTKTSRKCMMKKKNKPVSFGYLVKNAKLAIKDHKPDDIKSAINVVVKSVKADKKGKRIRHPRTIKLPNIKGGVLPLIPIFGALSALGSIIGSSASVWNAIKQTRKGQMEMQEKSRHNKAMEEIEIAKTAGNGYFLRQNKNGRGYFLKTQQKNQ